MTPADQIAVAAGMVAEQSDCSIAAAMLALRTRAKTGGGRTILAVAVAVIDHHEAAIR